MGIHIAKSRPRQSTSDKKVSIQSDAISNSRDNEAPFQMSLDSTDHEYMTSGRESYASCECRYQEVVMPHPQCMQHHGGQNERIPSTPNAIRNSSRKSHGSSFAEEVVNEIPRRIASIWRKVDDGLGKWLEINKRRPVLAKKGWKVVTLFVSSTFTDFYSEREVLIKRVVPQLNEWCLERKIRLMECDLRWGIPKDSTTNDTIDICMNEIEKCQEETGGQAFFVNLLGERYGWIPNLPEISQEVVDKYDLINGISITHAEVLNAALRSNSKNALFLFRDASILSQLPEQIRPLFIEDTDFGRQSLAELKRQLRDRFPEQVLAYSCSFDSFETHPESTKVTLTDLDGFEKKVVEFLKAAIEQTYPHIDEDLTKDEWNFVFQDIFIEKKGAFLVGREAERNNIIDFVTGLDGYTDTTPNYLLLTGSPGIGKSSLLASVVRKMKAAGVYCIYNFASASPGSTISTSVREIFTRKLMTWMGLEHGDFDDMIFEDKIAKYHELMQLVAKEHKQLTLVFDAVNQFSNNKTSFLDWLPSDLQGNVRCIIGCIDESPLLDLIKKQLKPGSFVQMHIGGFGAADVREYIHSLFTQYNKRLDEEQLEMLASQKDAGNPLWLALACEELRLFGEFERLTNKIRELPDNLRELVFTVLQRLISEDETGLVKRVISFLVCSTSGLTETELRWSCGNGEEPLPLMTWKRCHILLQPYLLMVGRRRGEENLAFFHDSFNIIVKTRFLADSLEKRQYHSRLAKVFKNHCDDEARVAEELPTQLDLANEFRILVEFYKRDKRSIRTSSVERSFRLQKIRCSTMILGAQDMFRSPLYICNMCSHRMRAFTPAPLLNKDVCVICGGLVHFKQESRKAYLCMKHKENTSPGIAKCHICKSVIFLQQQQQQRMNITFNQMYLCVNCSSLGQRCINLEY